MDKKHAIILFSIGIAAIIIAAYIFLPKSGSGLARDKAIDILKTEYPEFNDYPSDTLPPKDIAAEQGADGWHVAFMQLGSGRPMLSAKCFLVKNDGSIIKTGEFNPGMDSNVFEISPRTCGPI